MALLNTDGRAVEHVRYTAFGSPRRRLTSPIDIAYDVGTLLPPEGSPVIDGMNNGVTEGDYNVFFGAYFNQTPPGAAADVASDDGSPLPPLGPLNANNGVTEGDYNLFLGLFFDGWSNEDTYGLSTASIGNTIGYAGYEHDPVLLTPSALSADPNQSSAAYYHVRHRVYDAGLGRWTRRDPLGYVDGMGLYEYCASEVLACSDGYGLCRSCNKDGGSAGCSVFPRDFIAPIAIAPQTGDPCGNTLWALLTHPLVSAKLSALAPGCQSLGEITLYSSHCTGLFGKKESVPDTGLTTCSYFFGPSIKLCRTNNNTCPPISDWLDVLLHELEHIKQLCERSCFAFNNGSCWQDVKDELDAYCSEPGLQSVCSAARDTSKPPAQRCREASRLCKQVVISLTGRCLVDTQVPYSPSSPYFPKTMLRSSTAHNACMMMLGCGS